MPLVDIKCPDGSVVQMLQIAGVSFKPEMVKMITPGQDMDAHMETVKTMSIRDDDVYIATYPKAGTHWIWEVVSMVMKGKADYEVKTKETAMLEFVSKDKIESLPSPRILNCHFPVHLTPQELKTKKTKIIHVIRNPKDVAVSKYNFNKKMPVKTKSPLLDSFGTFLKYFMGDLGPHDFYPYYKYVLEWERLAESHPDQVLTVYFEDMKEDLVREVKKIAAFLNLATDDSLAKDIAAACQFDLMKKADAEVKDKPSFKANVKMETSTMYRKGEVGDWKNWFTVAENERFDQWISEHLGDTKLKIRYQL